MSKRFALVWSSFLLICLSLVPAAAQQTAFTYQGKLTDNGNPANGNYDLQIALFDSLTSGGQIGQTQTIPNVSASGGVFTVTLDFGPAAFSGGPRFLEISTRPSGAGNFTLLTPRQPISSTPYATRSLNATTADMATDAQRLGGVTADQYVQTTDARLSDSRAPLAGSTNYLQNTTTTQANSNFSISGDGSAGGMLGAQLMSANHYKINDRDAIRKGVGKSIELGDDGGNVGIGSFFPAYKLEIRSNGNQGLRVQTDAAGGAVASFGGLGDFSIDAPGFGGGRMNVKENGDVGFGIALPTSRFHFVDPSNRGLRVENTVTGGTVASFGGTGEFRVDGPGVAAGRFVVKQNGFVGIGWPDPSNALDVNGNISFSTLGAAGSSHLCLNNLNQIASCSSSLRYKTELHPFRGGLNLIDRLQPLTFRWKTDQTLDLGLGAEDVAAVEPLLVTHNAKGEIEGVKYDRLSAVFINAFKEQQNQIASLVKANARLSDRLRAIELRGHKRRASRNRPR